jgi:hypothetical protein
LFGWSFVVLSTKHCNRTISSILRGQVSAAGMEVSNLKYEKNVLIENK